MRLFVSRLLNRQAVGVTFDNREQARAGAIPALANGGGRLAGNCDRVGAVADGVGDEETGRGAGTVKHREKEAAPG